MIANMAAVSQRQVILGKDGQAHPWFAVDPDSKRHTEGFAAVLVTDREGKPVGAICLTSEDRSAIPTRGDGPESAQDLQRFESVLLLWAATFTLPIRRYFEVVEGGEHA
jgi:hypothetical protein